MSNLAMNKPTDYEDKRKRKILSNGKHDVVSIYQGGPFTVVPRRAFNDKRIAKSPVTLIILGTLCTCANNFTGVCFPTYEYIVNATGKTLPTISISINRLIEWGYIKRLRKGSPLYKNVKHKSSIYRILYDPLSSDAEVKSNALNNDPELQKQEEKHTLNKLNNDAKKQQTFSSHTKKDFSLRLSKTRLIELDTINNNKNNSIREEEVNEMVLMRMFKEIHFEVYKSRFIPNQKDWSQMTKIMKYKIPSKVLMQTIKRILLRFEINKQKLPSYPLGLVLSSLDEKEGTTAELIKDLAKKLRNIHR